MANASMAPFRRMLSALQPQKKGRGRGRGGGDFHQWALLMVSHAHTYVQYTTHLSPTPLTFNYTCTNQPTPTFLTPTPTHNTTSTHNKESQNVQAQLLDVISYNNWVIYRTNCVAQLVHLVNSSPVHRSSQGRGLTGQRSHGSGVLLGGQPLSKPSA